MPAAEQKEKSMQLHYQPCTNPSKKCDGVFWEESVALIKGESAKK